VIPGIEEILAGLLTGEYTLTQATLWVYKHQEMADAAAVQRDEFAGRAMQALIASRMTDYEGGHYDESRVAQNAYAMADAMLEARTA